MAKKSATKKTAKKSASKVTKPVKGSVTLKHVDQMNENFNAHAMYKVMQNAVTKTPVSDLAMNREVVAGAHHSFSIRLDEWEVTNQKKSGRCWMFAGTNMLRVGAMKKMNLKKFEFSQNFTLFWDKFEKANHFYEAIINTVDRDQDDRTVAYLLGEPISDGGQWNMFVNVIKKHGLVPKAAMPETESSSNTREMNGRLVRKLRQGAMQLRQLHENGATAAQLRELKMELMHVIHRILCIHLGTPPKKFDWQWTDDKGKFHRDSNLTPQKFAEKYITVPLDDYVCIVHDPRNPYGKTYTVDYLGNVVGGDIVKYLNVEIDVMKDVAVKMLKDGLPIWMGCDVGKHMHREMGIWDAELYDFDSIYNTDFSMSKAERLLYKEAFMTHAMMFTGVDMVGKEPRRWRVENSWGETGGEKGFYLMNDSWFDEHMFEIAAPKKYLPAKLRKALEQKPAVLPAWDPMGSLAK